MTIKPVVRDVRAPAEQPANGRKSFDFKAQSIAKRARLHFGCDSRLSEEVDCRGRKVKIFRKGR
jgi:hypothetical protein